MILSQENLSEVPLEIKILPLGAVNSEKGSFIVNDESFNLIEKQFKGRGLDIVVDYEHQTLKNVQAPAAGWINNLKKGTDAIIAEVKWTDKAREYLKNKEYKYLSPVIRVRKDGLAVGLHSVALTNTPAIDKMFPLVLKNLETEEIHMEFLKEIAEKLGIKLSDDMSDEEIAQAIFTAIPEPTQKKEENTELIANKNILNLLGLKEDAKQEDVVSAILSLKQEDGLQEKYLGLKARLDKKEADELVMFALTSGKITKDQKQWAQEYALSNKESFEKFLEKAPQVVPIGDFMGSLNLDLKSKQKEDETDETVLAICKSMGVSQEDIKKYGKDDN